MSENTNTNEITEVDTAQSEIEKMAADVQSSETAKRKRGYQNKVARLLNNFAFAGVLLTIITLGVQCFLSITSFIQQAPIGIAVLYAVVSVLTPLFAMLAACGLFKFLAEVVELLDRNGKN